MKELTGEQRRQLIDSQQVHEAWRAADIERRRRFAGSMRWAARNGTEYLLRKVGIKETSLGRRDSETEAAYAAFMEGRHANKERLKKLSRRLNELAPVNRAMGIGRMPTIAARILRRCDAGGLIGRQLFVVGTNALFAYETLAGVQLDSGLLASGDIDLLYDARRRLSLALAEDLREVGLVGLLRQVDRSFALPHPRSFRASNNDGYLVDLIRPQSRDVFRDKRLSALTDLPDDMEGAAIFGLDWLVNAPKVEAIVLDERGYPARIVAIDPRMFALHKAWVAEREDRDPVKARRDREQARAAALLAVRYLRLPFEGPEISAMPVALRALAPGLLAESVAESRDDGASPDW